jgi:hypothetical protein
MESSTPDLWPGLLDFAPLAHWKCPNFSGSAKGVAIPQPSPKGWEHGFVMICGLKGRDIMPFGHHKPRTGQIAGIQPADSSHPSTQP